MLKCHQDFAFFVVALQILVVRELGKKIYLLEIYLSYSLCIFSYLTYPMKIFLLLDSLLRNIALQSLLHNLTN